MPVAGNTISLSAETEFDESLHDEKRDREITP
jgi:hypothetical protein